MYKFFEAGDRIEARYKGGSQFWPGRVMRDNDDQTYDIVYDLPDMYEKKVPVERVRKIRSFEAPATVPLLELGDRTRKEEDEEVAKQRLKVNFAVPNPTSLFEHNMNWRLLKPDRVPKGFVSRCKKPRIGYAMPESPVNSFPKMSIVGLLDPAVFAHENDIADLLDIEVGGDAYAMTFDREIHSNLDLTNLTRTQSAQNYSHFIAISMALLVFACVCVCVCVS